MENFLKIFNALMLISSGVCFFKSLMRDNIANILFSGGIFGIMIYYAFFNH